MSLAAEVVEDLDAALQRLTDGEDFRLKRRALREALGHLYTLRAHREGQLPRREDYWRVADADADGRVAEAIIFIRGLLVHDVTREVGPREATGYLPYYTSYYPGSELVWRTAGELSQPLTTGRGQPMKRLANYEASIAGRAVLDTLLAARRFLVESAALPPL